MSFIRFLLGKPLANKALDEQRLPKIKALPVFSSDALSSVAYATEEILRVLAPFGAALMCFSLPVAGMIGLLILILVISYWQTIHAYPNGGGAFTVAQENLGPKAGLVAASALLIDYVLTVAVSITAGVRAIVSAFPVFYSHTVAASLIAIFIITVMNLRGVRESATAFAIPTYLFIALMLVLIFTGFIDLYFLKPEISIHPHAPLYSPSVETLSPWVFWVLMLKAFSAGCTAMTGIECVANGVPVFEKPEADNAAKTLLIVGFLLIILFGGVTYLSYGYALMPDEKQSLLSQLGRCIFGESFFYYALQASTALILLLAANTAFAGFPRLVSILADKHYLPKQLGNVGDRLSFSNGIFLLAALSGLLIIFFKGATHALVPLYAVGVFIAFCFSQLGMVCHGYKNRKKHWPIKAWINALGFLSTALALLFIIESKFFQGAWLVVFCIPVFLTVFNAIHKHYATVDRELSMDAAQAHECLTALAKTEPKIILPLSKIHYGTLAALDFATRLSSDVTAVMVALDPHAVQAVQTLWGTLKTKVPLVILESPYRSMTVPLKKFIREQDLRDPEQGLCVLVFPRAIPTHAWQDMLHNQRSFLLKTLLVLNRKNKGDTRVFVDVPYQLKR